MKMQFLCLFTVFVTVSAFGKPIPGRPINKNTDEYEKPAWNYVEKINEGFDGPNYLIPIQVINARTRFAAGPVTTLQIRVGESTCARSMKVSEITSSQCQVKSHGHHFLWEVEVWSQPWKNLTTISASKIRDVEMDEVFTTTTTETPFKFDLNNIIPLNQDDLDHLFNNINN